MSRWLVPAAALAALLLTALAGCGSSPTTGPAKDHPTGAAGPATHPAADSGRGTPKSGGHNDPG